MSLPRPVVPPDTESLPDTVAPDAGILYNPAYPDGLLRAPMLCRSLDLETMGKCAYEHVCQFTFDDLARGTLRAYGSDGS